jgi:hypothetical protein
MFYEWRELQNRIGNESLAPVPLHSHEMMPLSVLREKIERKNMY